jgi:hypothetical protein
VSEAVGASGALAAFATATAGMVVAAGRAQERIGSRSVVASARVARRAGRTMVAAVTSVIRRRGAGAELGSHIQRVAGAPTP